jgi:hypothetical protein
MGKPAVFAVHKSETADGKYHEVIWAKDGNLNAASRRGNIKRFRLWTLAKRFAVNKAKKMKARLSIS